MGSRFFILRGESRPLRGSKRRGIAVSRPVLRGGVTVDSIRLQHPKAHNSRPPQLFCPVERCVSRAQQAIALRMLRVAGDADGHIDLTNFSQAIA